MYVQTVRRSIYETMRPELCDLPIRHYKQRPQGPTSLALLHVILPSYRLIYTTPTSTSMVRRRHDFRKHSAATSISLSLCHQVFEASSFIIIDSSALVAFFGLVLFDSTHLVWMDSTHGFWLDLTQFVFLRLNSYLTLSHFKSHHSSPIHSGFMESHVVQGVLKIIQHWNGGIFHSSDNLNIFLVITL